MVLKKWTNWKLHYVLSDDSGAEQRAFRLAFPGLVAGETEVNENLIFYSTTNIDILDKPPSLPGPLYTDD